MEFEDVIKKRASIRKYAEKKPDTELAIAAIEAAHVAPTPGNIQILRYIIVEKKEIVSFNAKYKDKDGKLIEAFVSKDEGIRKDATVEGLGKLKPAFKTGGTTTAGNSSQVFPITILFYKLK